MSKRNNVLFTVLHNCKDVDAARDCTAAYFCVSNAGTEYDHKRYTLDQLIDRVLNDMSIIAHSHR